MKFDPSVDWFYKYPEGKFGVEYDYSEDLDSGEALDTCTASIYDEDGTDVTAAMISNTGVTTPDVMFTIQGGSAGKTYTIKLVGLTDQSSRFPHYLVCEVFGAVVLNTKIGDPAANSYTTIKEANTYMRSEYAHDNQWDTLNIEAKKKVLIEAAKDMEVFSYTGERYYPAQGLKFPRDDHEVVTGNCATPITTNSFRHSSLYSSVYGVYPTSYWRRGTVHITSGTPVHDIKTIASSNVTTGSLTMSNNFSATPTSNTKFDAFAPVDKKIKDAQCEQALFLLKNTDIDTLQEYRDSGVRSVTIGDTSVDFTDGHLGKIAISSKSKKLLSLWIRKQIRVGRA